MSESITLNDSFTIDDIHRIRVENYERTKLLSPAELIAKTKANAEIVLKQLADMGSVIYRNEADARKRAEELRAARQ